MTERPISDAWMEKMKGKNTFIHRLFTVFITEEPKRVELIREALKQRDAAQMAYLTHSLKGSAATMGAEALRQSCLDLELAAKAEDLEHSETHFRILEIEINRVYGFMQEFLDELDAA